MNNIKNEIYILIDLISKIEEIIKKEEPKNKADLYILERITKTINRLNTLN